MLKTRARRWCRLGLLSAVVLSIALGVAPLVRAQGVAPVEQAKRDELQREFRRLSPTDLIAVQQSIEYEINRQRNQQPLPPAADRPPVASGMQQGLEVRDEKLVNEADLRTQTRYQRLTDAMQQVSTQTPGRGVTYVADPEAVSKVFLRLSYSLCSDRIFDINRVNLWKDDLVDFVGRMTAIMHSIGQVRFADVRPSMNDPNRRVASASKPFGSTVAIGPNLAVTNYHVVKNFIEQRPGVRGPYAIRPESQLEIDFIKEYSACRPALEKVIVRRVLAVDEHLDLALMEFAGSAPSATLEFKADTVLETFEVVAVIGFPFDYAGDYVPDYMLEWGLYDRSR